MKKENWIYVIVLVLIGIIFIAIGMITDAQSAEVQRVITRANQVLEESPEMTQLTYTWPPKPNNVSESYWNELKYNSRTNNGMYICPDFSLYDWNGVNYPGFGD